MILTHLMGFAFVLLGYLSGSVSSAILVCQVAKLPDPREQGSGNPGATNVLRIGGKKWALLVLIGDVLKGFLPVLLAKLVGVMPIYVGLVALGAFFGHLYPVFFRFKGGKGVATGFGVMLGLSPIVAAIMVGVWLLVAFTTGYSSLAALTATLMAPPFLFIFAHTAYFLPMCVALLFVIYRHLENIKRLLKGEETKMRLKKK